MRDSNECKTYSATRHFVEEIVSAALPGHVVVELPEPTTEEGQHDPVSWEVEEEGEFVQVDSGRVHFAYWVWSPSGARAMAAVLLAAADRAERQEGAPESEET